MVDAAGLIRLINRQAEVLFGYTRDELLGRPVEVLVPERVAAKHPGLRKSYFADPRTRPMGAGLELTARRKDGTEFPVDIALAPLETKEGTLVSAAVRDITDRVAAEAARASLAAIVSSSGDAIIGKALDGTITSWNPGAERVYGWAAQEVEGGSIDALLRPEDAAEERSILERVKKGEHVIAYETRRFRKDGTLIDISVSMFPIRDAKGIIIGIASINRDITEQKRAEATQILLESAPDAMVVVDSAGLIRLVNRQTEALFGSSRDELLGRPVEDLVPGLMTRNDNGLRNGPAAGEPVRPTGMAFELIARRKDGTKFPVDVSLSPLETPEGTLVSAAIRDITERKKQEAERELLETRLNQAQRLESLGQLAGGVAHDFNNLLAVILNYAAFVMEETDDPAAIRRDVGEIRLAAERAAALTHQLLIFGRREVINPEVLDLNEVVRDLERLLHRTIGEHIHLKTQLDPGLWPIKADPSGIEQILMNLVVNARDAMAAGGTLLIETSNVDITAEFSHGGELPPGPYVRLTVADTGTGMSPEVSVRALEPFYTTKSKGEGSGLGLATVYGIAKQAGGDVHLYSEPGLGTTVRVFLPVTEERAALRRSGDRGPEAQGRGETILVVEDEDQVRELTRRVLSRHGYQVRAASNGKEALAFARSYSGEIHLLLTDVVMPDMSGKELAERLVEERPGITVLYMSGYPQDVLERGAIAAGLPLMEKPFTAEVLTQRVRAALDAGTQPGRQPRPAATQEVFDEEAGRP